MFKKKQKLLPAANAAVAVISDDMTAVAAPQKAVKHAADKAAKKAKRKKRAGSPDRVGQIVTILAIVMAAAYIIVRIINWVRFTGV